MAKNRKGGGRIGAIRERTQFQLPSGHYAKRDTRTGEILSIKADLKPYKGIVKERQPEQPQAAPHPMPPMTRRMAFPRVQAWEWSVRRTPRAQNRPATITQPMPAMETGLLTHD